MKYLLFDLDGTIADTEEGILSSVKYALNELKIDEPDITRLKQFIGPPLKSTFQLLYDLDDKSANTATTIFREYYAKDGKYQCKLYDGMLATLQLLKDRGYVLFIATSKPTVFANDIANHLGVNSFFEEIVGSNLDNTRSKKADIIQYILDKYGIEEKNEVVMIGDKSHDLIGAMQCNIKGIGVTFGYGTRDELNSCQHEALINSPEELGVYFVKE